MKRWWLILALLLSVGINVGILSTLALRRGRPALAPPEIRAPEGPPRAAMERLVHRLGLEGEERERFIQIQRRFFAGTVENRLRLRGLHRAVRLEVEKAEPDRAHLDSLLEEAAELNAARDRLWVEAVLESRALLDPRQQREYLRFFAVLDRMLSQPRGDRQSAPRQRWRGEGSGFREGGPPVRRDPSRQRP